MTLVEKADRDELIFTIFGRENWENYNLSESIFVFIENIDSDEGKQFFRFYKNFCIHKWNFLRDYQTDISPRTWVKLVEQDILIFDKLVKSDSTFNIFKIEFSDNAISRNLNLEKNKKIKEFLFELLLDKEGVNLDDVLISIKKEIQRFSQNKSDQFYRYTYDFLKFRLVTILDKYENDDVNINLPEYKNLSDAFQNGQRNDYENSMLYSKICFNYLDRGRIEDFSHTKVEADDSKEREKQKLKAQKIQGLILSMNEEYRMAFILYQLFYTDRTQWDENLAFYDNNIQSIMKHGKQYHGYLFDQVKNIILSETDIDHRITESFLDKIWETKNETIMDFSWFDQFGVQHLMSDFKILYVQWLLSEEKNSYPGRFCIDIGNSDRERIGYFCREYLNLTDMIESIFTKKSFSSKTNKLQTSVEYVLHNDMVKLSNVINNISVSSFLRLEWILRENYYHYHSESNYTSRTFFDAMASNDRYYWSAGRGILEFFIVKIVDNFYRDLYQNEEFMAGFKYHLESQLNSLNKTVEEYVELIIEKVSKINNISILQKDQIISRLNDILFGQKMVQK
ncbi:hypothetical protein Q7V51_06435 [Streptococcus suis]|nr:hypothetical protein [Streptococcus suis]MDW8593847.1 hypothetical protein [Streptococcus suis]MDW8623355.1 hypothetical protein [Streptococcus suis]VTS98309.1 membrane protein [Streptococcus suis]